ncbi:type I-E CRISPR-associated protein Cse2/CasB [Saccharothrix longispora]|uniref:type I-E CRISPR-associated protein Cse2/CasB n=1 Tax=Saccharothrix longispora TaxID=33920 RepID=UPI0028FDC25E|nr:type I-E CRISPR-associated protein Cse2/CasB [Saccharothrix longispora]MDU0289568.1 type I-E CRISPR-associated protein Cse2/CasB [Saccharothrix longispora]
MTTPLPSPANLTEDRRQFSTRFVTRIVALCEEDPGARAALKSGLGRTPQHRESVPMHRYLARFTRDAVLGGNHGQRCLYTIASLVAYRHETSIPAESPGNIGASFAYAANTRAFAVNTMDKSVQRLARQTADTVCAHLSHVLIPLRSGDIPVDFPRLLGDLIAWRRYHREIGTRWMQTFHLELDHDA